MAGYFESCFCYYVAVQILYYPSQENKRIKKFKKSLFLMVFQFADECQLQRKKRERVDVYNAKRCDVYIHSRVGQRERIEMDVYFTLTSASPFTARWSVRYDSLSLALLKTCRYFCVLCTQSFVSASRCSFSLFFFPLLLQLWEKRKKE